MNTIGGSSNSKYKRLKYPAASKAYDSGKSMQKTAPAIRVKEIRE